MVKSFSRSATIGRFLAALRLLPERLDDIVNFQLIGQHAIAYPVFGSNHIDIPLPISWKRLPDSRFLNFGEAFEILLIIFRPSTGAANCDEYIVGINLR